MELLVSLLGDNLYTTAYWIIWLLTNIGCTYFVYQSAIHRQHATMGINAYWWAIFSLLGGIWTLLIYWLIEQSMLSPNQKNEQE